MCVPDSGPENMAAKPADKAAVGTRFGMLYTGRVPKMAPGTRLGPDNSPDPAPAPPPPPAPTPAPAAPQLQTPTTVEQKKVRGTRTVRKKTNRQSISTGLNASAPTGAGSGGLNI